MRTLHFRPPSSITADIELAKFDSGEISLNEWLKKRALKNHLTGASRCFVLFSEDTVIGQALLRGAMIRAVNVSGDAGIFAILVHAINDQAKQFFLSRGFVESPMQPMTLMMTIDKISSILTEPS